METLSMATKSFYAIDSKKVLFFNESVSYITVVMWKKVDDKFLVGLKIIKRGLMSTYFLPKGILKTLFLGIFRGRG